MRHPVGLALLLCSAIAHAGTYYVAPTGNDGSGDGSDANPWATIGHALSAVPGGGGHEIVVRDGEYHGTITLSRPFDQTVVVRAEHPYRAKLTNTDGAAEVLRVYVVGQARVRFTGFIFTNEHSSYTCPGGRESYYVIHLQDASAVALVDNIIHGNNAPGRCNELLKNQPRRHERLSARPPRQR